jgi:acetoin utilization deacetylase AcuC-like enzyme
VALDLVIGPTVHPVDSRSRQPTTPPGLATWAYETGRLMRRTWRRLRLFLNPPACAFAYHPGFAQSLPGIPIDEHRGEKVLAFLKDEGLLRRSLVLRPRMASLQEVLRVHPPAYLATLHDPEVLGRILGSEVAASEVERILDWHRLVVGGTLLAARATLTSRGAVMSLGGGFHHALADMGMGFCVFNDVAVAIADLRSRGFGKPILVVDLDLHDGNGTRALFARDPTVHTYSVHGENWGPADAVASTTVPLGHEVDDERYLGTLMATLPPLAEALDPGLVIYLAGADPAWDDRLGDWRITPAALLARDRFVAELFRKARRPVPMLVVLAGGYGESAWRYPARFAAWLLSGRTIEPPENEDLALRRFRKIGESLRLTDLTSEGDGFSFKISEADLVGIHPGFSQPSRFLGCLSRHGVELLLERFGLLDRLRAKGFAHLKVDLDLEGATGQTLRILTDDSQRHLLVELRVLRTLRIVPGMELVSVEWLLLQNPQERFSALRRRLPGQQHPGLGLLKELLGWLIILCEMQGLDGIHFAPSHYHIAVQSRRIVRFIQPEHEARMRAMVDALRGIPLFEASRAVDEGLLVDTKTGERVSWEALPMVVPVSARLKERVQSAEYEARVQEVRRGLDLALIEGRAPVSRSALA